MDRLSFFIFHSMEVFIILLLILLNGLFAMSEIALISARKSNLTAQAKQGNKRARQALKLAERSQQISFDRPDRYYSDRYF